jgi:C4-dicarboxylate-specific signal transduction histidine kinase
VVRKMDSFPAVTLVKHKLLQILINLLRNAAIACGDSDRVDRILSVRAWLSGNRVVISVRDNGTGIAPEHMNSIFAHGFTTRKDGHGFGLHSAALFAAELGGTLAADSDGAGMGATFTLDLPVARHDAATG